LSCDGWAACGAHAGHWQEPDTRRRDTREGKAVAHQQVEQVPACIAKADERRSAKDAPFGSAIREYKDNQAAAGGALLWAHAQRQL